MNRTPCPEGEEEMLHSVALEVLDSADFRLVLAHALDCADCGRLLEEYREVTAALALALPHQPLEPGRSARVRARLLARARGNPSASSASAMRAEVPSRPRLRPVLVDRWAGWAVAAGLAGVLLVHHGFHRPLAYGWVAAGLLAVILVAIGVYARIQRGRAVALQDRLSQYEQVESPGPARP
jgi:hypothetical protein